MILKNPINLSNRDCLLNTKFKKNKIYDFTYSSFLKVVFLIILFFSQQLITNAQFRIKEKIEIKPKTSKSIELNFNKTLDNGHSLRAVHIWDQTYLGVNNDIPMSRMRFRFKTNFCNQIFYSDFDYSGNLEYTLTDLMGTSYTIELLLSQRTAWDPVYRGENLHGGGFQVYVDGEFAVTGHNSTFVEPWFGYLGIDIAGNEIYFNEDGINVNPNTNKSCSPILGYLHKDWPTVTITSGQQYLSFYDEQNDDTLGNSYYFGDFVVDNEVPKIIYDQPYFKNEPFYGVVKAEVNGIEAFDTLQIMKAEDLELDVQIVPEEITPNELADIFLKEISDDELIDFASDQLFNVEIIDGAEYGTILSSNGIDKADSFSQIAQGFKFIADSEIELDSVEVLIKVSAKIIADEETLTKVNNNVFMEEGRENPNIRKTKNENEIKDEIQNRPNIETFIFIPPDEDREIFGVGSVKIINKDSLDHFQITIIPDTLSTKDTLAFTETARIFVQAKDADSNNIELDNTKLLSFRVTTNTSYGTFISSYGDTLKTEPVVLQNISYADAKNGEIKFAAVKENPDSVLRCNIEVALDHDSTKNGNRDAIVLEQTLKIVINGSREVRPNVSNINVLANATLQNLQSYRKQFFVSFTRGGNQIRGHNFNLKTDYIVGSGGHNHRNIRRSSTTNDRKYWNYGHFRKTTNPTILANPIMDTTNNDYLSIEYNYLSSRWGNKMNLILSSLQNSLLTDTVLINERIPDLILLQPSEDYILIGGTCNHNGPSRWDSVADSCQIQDDNHWGTAIVIRRLIAIAQDWANEHPELLLEINDISLPYGGKFDINGNWEEPHETHREGEDVDIRSHVMTTADETNYYFDVNNNGVYDGEIDERIVNTGHTVPDNYRLIDNTIQEFRAICQDRGAQPVLELPGENNEHFHLNF